jgi:hypothetical protein
MEMRRNPKILLVVSVVIAAATIGFCCGGVALWSLSRSSFVDRSPGPVPTDQKPEQQGSDAVSVAKAELEAEARETHQEITEIEVSYYYEWEPGPADRANGIQAGATVYLLFAHRCSKNEDWVTDYGDYTLRKVNDKWEIDPEERDQSGASLRDCTLSTPTPVD